MGRVDMQLECSRALTMARTPRDPRRESRRVLRQDFRANNSGRVSLVPTTVTRDFSGNLHPSHQRIDGLIIFVLFHVPPDQLPASPAP